MSRGILVLAGNLTFHQPCHAERSEASEYASKHIVVQTFTDSSPKAQNDRNDGLKSFLFNNWISFNCKDNSNLISMPVFSGKPRVNIIRMKSTFRKSVHFSGWVVNLFL